MTDPRDLLQQMHDMATEAHRWSGYALTLAIVTTAIAMTLLVLQTAELMGWRP